MSLRCDCEKKLCSHNCHNFISPSLRINIRTRSRFIKRHSFSLYIDINHCWMLRGKILTNIQFFSNVIRDSTVLFNSLAQLHAKHSCTISLLFCDDDDVPLIIYYYYWRKIKCISKLANTRRRRVMGAVAERTSLNYMLTDRPTKLTTSAQSLSLCACVCVVEKSVVVVVVMSRITCRTKIHVCMYIENLQALLKSL